MKLELEKIALVGIFGLCSCTSVPAENIDMSPSMGTVVSVGSRPEWARKDKTTFYSEDRKALYAVGWANSYDSQSSLMMAQGIAEINARKALPLSENNEDSSKKCKRKKHWEDSKGTFYALLECELE